MASTSSPPTPPWVSELLAMNRKVVRNLSTSSYFLEGISGSSYTESASLNVTKAPVETTASLKPSTSSTLQNGLVNQQRNSKQSGNPTAIDSNLNLTKSSSSTTEKQHQYGIRSISADEQMLRRTRGLNHAKGSTTVTEKSSPIREQDDRFMEDVTNHQKVRQMHEHLLNGSSGGGVGLERQDSILEYGPGIVRKLRSRYQSLALRQFNSRPSLRRSASLENVLDSLDSSSSVVESINHLEPPESPSPAPNEEDKESNYLKQMQHQQKVNNKLISSGSDVEENLTKNVSRPVNLAGDNDGLSHIKKQNEQHERLLSNSKGPAPLPPSIPRGRAQQSERKDRIRRARSVDALHRTKHEEEILEKFKAVVLPKEEIVIIEVSKPRANLNLTGLESNATSNNNMRTYYLATSNNNSGAVAADKSYPTQLLFGSGTSAESQQLSRGRSFASPEHELPPHDIVRETARIFEKNQENAGLKKVVGQALRLTKSNLPASSVSGNSSTIVAATSQEASPPPSQQRGTVMAQGTPSAIQQQVAEPRDKSPSITTSAKCNGTTSAIKQVGIIRPTVSNSHSPTSLNLTNGEKVTTTNNSQHEESFATRPPILSPILSPSSQSQAYKALLHAQNKPPLSPKPIFTSSPKPSAPAPVTTNLGHSKKPSTPTQSHLYTQSSLDKPMIIIKSKENSVVSSSPFLNKSTNISNTANSSNIGTNGPLSPVQRELSPILGDKLVNKIGENAATTSSSKVPAEDVALSNGRASPSFKRNQYSGPLKHATSEDTQPLKVENGRASPNTINGVSHVNGLVKHMPFVSQDKTIKTSESSAKLQQEPSKSMTKSLTTAEIQPPPVAPRTTSVTQSKKDDGNSSQLRAHQKQKSTQGGNSCMVFNFTARSSVPNYIEDDGLHHSRGRISLSGTVTDESVDNADSALPSGILKGTDAKPANFLGANVIINGKSSLQKKPKSQKLSISFNESATTTYEYPSELSLLAEEEANKEDMLGHKGPNVINNTGNGLGSYTSKLAKNDYQLGTYIGPTITKSNEDNKQKSDKQEEIIEDYLKPDSETTTWSNEITSDILF